MKLNKAFTILSILSLLLPFNAFATPVIEANGSGYAVTVNSLTYAVTIPVGLTNSTLIVYYQNTGGPDTDPTGITWNGGAMTLGTFATPYLESGFFYINNPTSGTHNVVLSYAANHQIFSYASVLSGADISASPVSNTGFCGTDSCTPTHTASAKIENAFTTTLNELVIDNVYYSCGGDPITSLGTNQTAWGTQPGPACPDQPEVYSSSKTATTTGSNTMYENLTGSASWGSMGISIKSAATPASAPAVNNQVIIFE